MNPTQDADPLVIIAPSCAGSAFMPAFTDALALAGATPTARIVVLPSGPVRDEDEPLVSALAGADGDIVPVVLGDAASEAFPDLSQIIVGDRSPAWAAAQASLVATVPGRDLVALQELQAASTRWEAEDRTATGLLPSGRVPAATALLPLATRAAWADAPTLVEFVAASARHARRRHRLLLSALSGLSVLLVVLSALALMSRAEAAQAAQAARLRAAESTSGRLVREVEAMLGSAPDPDLTHLLAARAVEADPTPAALEVARRVLDRIPTHRSLRLPANAIGVASAERTDLVAATLVDGRIVLVEDGAIRQEVRALPGRTLGEVGLHPDGTYLLALTDQGAFKVDARTPVEPRPIRLPEGVEPYGIRWIGDSSVLLSGIGPFRLDAEAHEATAWGQLPWRDDVTASDAAADGSLVGLVSRTHGVWVGNPETGATRYSSTETSVQDVVVTPTTVILVGSTSDRLVTEDGKTTELPGRPRSSIITALSDGTLGYTSVDGSRCTLDRTGGAWTACHPAHAGAATGMVVTPGGVVTVGLDGWLRTWDQQAPPTYMSDALTLDRLSMELGSRTQVRLAAHPRLRVDPATGRGTVFLPARGMMGTFDVRTLTLEKERFYRLWLGQYTAEISANGMLAGGWEDFVEVVNIAAGKSVWYTAAKLPASLSAGGGLLAVSPQGTAVAARRAGWQQVWTEDGPVSRDTHASASRVLSLRVTDAGEVGAITAEGEAALPGQGTLALVAPGESLSAATWDAEGRPVAVDANGAVLHYPEGVRGVLGQLPAGFGAWSVVVSPSGNRVALLGTDELRILDRPQGAVLLQVRGATAADVVQDIAFLSDDEVLVIRGDGGLVSHQLVGDQSVAEQVTATAPRELTADEMLQFGIE